MVDRGRSIVDPPLNHVLSLYSFMVAFFDVKAKIMFFFFFAYLAYMYVFQYVPQARKHLTFSCFSCLSRVMAMAYDFEFRPNIASIFDLVNSDMRYDHAIDWGSADTVTKDLLYENEALFSYDIGKDPFDAVPEEIVWHMFAFMDAETQFAAADVCKRFRSVAYQLHKSFAMDMYPSCKRLEQAAGFIVRLVHLRSLDLSCPSCVNFMQTNADIVSFGISLAASCPRIESFALLGQRGARLLKTYITAVGEDSCLTKLTIDIQRAAIGCASCLMAVSKRAKLSCLTITTSRSVWRNFRTIRVLEQLFAHLLPGVSCLTLRFADSDSDIVSAAVLQTSGLRYFASDGISEESLATLAQRNPNIQTLKLPAHPENLKRLALFQNLQNLSILNSTDLELETEEVEEAFGTEPVSSQLQVLKVSGPLSENPLQGISLLSNLQTLILDLACHPLFSAGLLTSDDQKPRRMLKLKQLVFLMPSCLHFPDLLLPDQDSPFVNVLERSHVAELFPNLEKIRCKDGEFRVKENYSFRRHAPQLRSGIDFSQCGLANRFQS